MLVCKTMFLSKKMPCIWELVKEIVAKALDEI
jgi:hypothetical protein